MDKSELINRIMCVAGKKNMLEAVISVCDVIEADGNMTSIRRPGTKIACIDEKGNIYETDEVDESMVQYDKPPNRTLFLDLCYEDGDPKEMAKMIAKLKNNLD